MSEAARVLSEEQLSLVEVARQARRETAAADNMMTRDEQVKASLDALHNAQVAFSGLAERLEVRDEDDIQRLINEIRHEIDE